MNKKIKKYYIKSFSGAKLVEIKRVCDLICFTFETESFKKIHLHLQCFLRIFDCTDELVICTQNLLDPSRTFKEENFDWTEVGSTLFDDAMGDFQSKLFSTKVSHIKFNGDDLNIFFYNQMRLNVLITSTIYDDNKYSENYRIFDKEDHTKDLVL